MSIDSSANLLEQFTNTSDEQLKKGFMGAENIDVNQEIEKREKLDGYEFRKFFNQAIQKAFLCIPYLTWPILSVCTLCICVI